MINVNDRLKTYSLFEVPNLKVHGRTTGRLNPVTLFWTGSAIEFNAKGSELWLEIEANYDSYEPWISIVINSVPVSRVMVTAGRHWICVFRGMSGQAVKNVRVVKDVQAMSGDPGCFLHIHAVKFDGEFQPVAEKPYKIEFIGDSITSGEGAIGSTVEEDWIPMWFSAVYNYAAITGDALHADYRILSQSGWGVLTSWDNNPHANMPAYYEQVCGLLTGEINRTLGAHEVNDFEAWQPDVVVVNLGTNDGAAFDTSAWTDPITGKMYKQRLNEDGTFHEEDLQAFVSAATEFLAKLRYHNKRAHIIWTYGMLGTSMMPAISCAVADYTQKTGDKNVSVIQLPTMREDSVGARSHPGALAHEEAAKVLVEYITRLL